MLLLFFSLKLSWCVDLDRSQYEYSVVRIYSSFVVSNDGCISWFELLDNWNQDIRSIFEIAFDQFGKAPAIASNLFEGDSKWHWVCCSLNTLSYFERKSNNNTSQLVCFILRHVLVIKIHFESSHIQSNKLHFNHFVCLECPCIGR